MKHDLEIFEKKKQVAVYTEGFKSDPSKRVWLEGCIKLGKSTYRNSIVQF